MVKKLKFKINSSPHLNCFDITKQLFNSDFQSDVQFIVENTIIYAHSLELMKRSVVFEERLENLLGEQKLIPIVDCKYLSFLEFMRFIYTDECTINVANGIELLKLATQYKVIKLENKVINCMYLCYSKEWLLMLFEYCVLEEYDLVRNTVHCQVARNLNQCLEGQQFQSLHPKTMDALLKFDRIPKGVSESDIYMALGNWVALYCKKNELALSDGRHIFDSMIRKIRFPTMSNKMIKECSKKFPGLLSKLDSQSIAEQTIFGGCDGEQDLWISKRREEFMWPYEYGTFSRDNKYETRLSVSREIILHGLRIGANPMLYEKTIELEISTNDSDKFIFQLSGFMFWDLIINLGDSFRLKSNCVYKITIKYLDTTNKNIQILRRKEGFNAIINDATKSVHMLQISRNVFEMFFLSPAE